MSGSSRGDEGAQYYLDPNSTLNTSDLGSNLKQFAATSQGSSYADQIAQNNGAPIYSNRQGGWATAGPNGEFQDASWVTEYMQWLAQNQSEQTNSNAYEALNAKQPGIQSTILTGPQSGSLTASVLGAKS